MAWLIFVHIYSTSSKIFLSSNGYLTPLISWYFSWPFPATRIISPGFANAQAVRIASLRFTIKEKLPHIFLIDSFLHPGDDLLRVFRSGIIGS